MNHNSCYCIWSCLKKVEKKETSESKSLEGVRCPETVVLRKQMLLTPKEYRVVSHFSKVGDGLFSLCVRS